MAGVEWGVGGRGGGWCRGLEGSPFAFHLTIVKSSVLQLASRKGITHGITSPRVLSPFLHYYYSHHFLAASLINCNKMQAKKRWQNVSLLLICEMNVYCKCCLWIAFRYFPVLTDVKLVWSRPHFPCSLTLHASSFCTHSHFAGVLILRMKSFSTDSHVARVLTLHAFSLCVLPHFTRNFR